jgi:hypothetical protein
MVGVLLSYLLWPIHSSESYPWSLTFGSSVLSSEPDFLQRSRVVFDLASICFLVYINAHSYTCSCPDPTFWQRGQEPGQSPDSRQSSCNHGLQRKRSLPKEFSGYFYILVLCIRTAHRIRVDGLPKTNSRMVTGFTLCCCSFVLLKIIRIILW